MASKGTRMRRLSLLPLFTLLACQGTAEIKLTQANDGQIYIGISRKGDEHPCVESLSITHTSEGKIHADWYIFLEDGRRDSCLNKFTYPNLPPHYDLLQEPNVLKPGEEYHVTISGAGFIADSQFVRAELPPQPH